MVYSESEILQYIEENDVKFVKLTFCTTDGKLKNISVLSSEMGGVFRHGAKISAKKIKGFEPAKGKDIFLFPDASTMTLLPWRPQQGRVIRMFCYIKYADGTPFEGDSRYFLKKAMKEAVRKGYCFRFGTSCEFSLFRLDENGFPTKIPHDYAGYCDIAPEDKGENFRRDVCLTMEQMGIHPISSRHESGPGQHEIDFSASSALKAADTFLSFKSAVRSVADNHGVHASFMPKSSYGMPGNGMHIGMSIINDSDIFDDDDSEAADDEAIRSATAGILKHICEFTVFTNSKVNSYSRLAGKDLPVYVTWSDEEDGQIIRINKKHSIEGKMVLKSPDCVCNPYYVFGLMIYASLEGIDNDLSLPDKFDPDSNEYKMLPQNISAAANDASQSDFLKKYLNAEILRYIEETAMEEWKDYQEASDKEQFEEKRYFYDL